MVTPFLTLFFGRGGGGGQGCDFSLEFSFNRFLEASSSVKMLTSAGVSVPGKKLLLRGQWVNPTGPACSYFKRLFQDYVG